MILISEKNLLRVIKTVFVTKDGEELDKEQLTDEQYQAFCNEFETSRLEHKILWREVDSKYNKQVKVKSDGK